MTEDATPRQRGRERQAQRLRRRAEQFRTQAKRLEEQATAIEEGAERPHPPAPPPPAPPPRRRPSGSVITDKQPKPKREGE